MATKLPKLAWSSRLPPKITGGNLPDLQFDTPQSRPMGSYQGGALPDLNVSSSSQLKAMPSPLPDKQQLDFFKNPLPSSMSQVPSLAPSSTPSGMVNEKASGGDLGKKLDKLVDVIEDLIDVLKKQPDKEQQKDNANAQSGILTSMTHGLMKSVFGLKPRGVPFARESGSSPWADAVRSARS